MSCFFNLTQIWALVIKRSYDTYSLPLSCAIADPSPFLVCVCPLVSFPPPKIWFSGSSKRFDDIPSLSGSWSLPCLSVFRRIVPTRSVVSHARVKFRGGKRPPNDGVGMRILLPASAARGQLPGIIKFRRQFLEARQVKQADFREIVVFDVVVGVEADQIVPPARISRGGRLAIGRRRSSCHFIYRVGHGSYT